MNWGRLILLVGLFGCSSDPEPSNQKEEITIFFNSPSKLEVKENNGNEIVLPIKLSVSEASPIEVTYEVIGQEVVNGSDFTILSENPLVIPAGNTEVNVSIQINNNEIIQTEERSIYLRLRTINQSHVKISVPKEVVITILEDDCAANISNAEVWMGALTIQNQNDTSPATGLENASGLCSGLIDIKGKFLGNQNPESTMTLQLTQDPNVITKGSLILERTKLFESTSQFEIEATGNYDELTEKMTLNYSFYDLNNSAKNFSGTMVITAN